MKRLLKFFALVLVLATVTPPAFGFLGLGDIVFDPTNYGEAIRQYLQLQQQYMQLIQTYQMIRNQYDHWVWMAKRVPVNMAARYRIAVTPWHYAVASNVYGTTGSWIAGMNSGKNVQTGYMEATQRLANYGSALASIPADQLERVKANYATVELTDGANLQAMETIGRLRANVPLVENAIQGLEEDSLSPDPAMNTEIAVLNKINAANLITIRNSQDTNKLLVALAEQQVIDAKRARDAEAQMINNHIRFMREGKAVMTAQAAGASAAMRAWRMP